MVLLRGIGTNWLVYLVCFRARMAKSYFSKVVVI